MFERLSAVVSGYVQGVGYRYFTYTLASHLGLTGWVRNLPDGRVELLAEGDTGKLQELLQGLKRGPSAASVSDVREDWSPATGEFDSFEISHY